MMKRHINLSHRPLLGLLIAGMLVLGSGCTRKSDGKKLSAAQREEINTLIKAQVEARLRQELPRLAAQVRADLTGKPLGPGPQRARPAMAKGPGDPATPATPVTGPAWLTQEPQVDAQGLKISRVLMTGALGTGDKKRQPASVATEFSVSDPKIYCWIEAVPGNQKRNVKVVWVRNGKVFHQLTLPPVGPGAIWRTWAYLRNLKKKAGQWTCGVFNEEGALLGKTDFVIK